MNPIVNVRMPSEINLWVRQLAFRRRRTVTDVVVAALALARDVLEAQEAPQLDEEGTNAAVDRFLTRIRSREEPVG